MSGNQKYQELKNEAILNARDKFHHAAIIYTLDGEMFCAGTHHEARYIRSYEPYDKAKIILVCEHFNSDDWYMYYPIYDKPNQPFDKLDDLL